MTTLINSDSNEIGDAAMKLANHVINLGVDGGLTTTLLQWFAYTLAFVIIPIGYSTLGVRSYLLRMEDANLVNMDNSNLLSIDNVIWRAKMIQPLLYLYVFLTFPNWLFGILRGQIGQWFALVGVLIRLLQGAELYPGPYLPIVVSPDFVAGYVREGWIGVIICIGIGCYLLQDHIRANGGFREAFTTIWGIFNTICIALLFVYPIWISITLI